MQLVILTVWKMEVELGVDGILMECIGLTRGSKKRGAGSRKRKTE